MQEIKHFRGYCFISLSVLYYENKYQGKFFPAEKPLTFPIIRRSGRLRLLVRSL
jgi:hypothetical protein